MSPGVPTKPMPNKQHYSNHLNFDYTFNTLRFFNTTLDRGKKRANAIKSMPISECSFSLLLSFYSKHFHESFFGDGEKSVTFQINTQTSNTFSSMRGK